MIYVGSDTQAPVATVNTTITATDHNGNEMHFGSWGELRRYYLTCNYDATTGEDDYEEPEKLPAITKMEYARKLNKKKGKR